MSAPDLQTALERDQRRRARRRFLGGLARGLAVLAYALAVLALAAYAPLTRSLWNQPGFLRGLQLTLGLTAVVALVWGAWQMRRRPLARLAGLAATAVVAWFAGVHGINVEDPAGSLRERMHLVYYGGFAVLFVLLWRRRFADASVYGYALVASLLLALADEALQWALPTRVGEWGDLRLNALSALMGLVFVLGVVEAWRPRWPVSARHKANLLYGVALVLVGLAGFLQLVHFGHQIQAPGIGSFRSRFERAELERLSREWRPLPPARGPWWRRVWQLEDLYAAEGKFHAARRNNFLGEHRVLEALKEQQILERYYTVFLERSDKDLTPGQRAELERRAGEDHQGYPYRGGPSHLVVWLPAPVLWLSTSLCVTLLALSAELIRLRR